MTMLRKKDWSLLPRRALNAAEIVTRLAGAPGWQLTGDGPGVAIEKTYTFDNYYETISFVNAVAFIANAQDHHPELSVHYGPLRGALQHARREGHLRDRLRMRVANRRAHRMRATRFE